MRRTGKALLWVGLLLAAGVWVSCGEKVDHHGLTPLVEVSGTYLYAEDLRKALPENLSKDDSVLFAEHYIRNWVEDALLLDNARRNVTADEGIDRLVENYRHALLLHSYQRKLMAQRLSKEINDADIDSFYRTNASLFRLERPLIKGLYIKVPLKEKGMNNVRKWYKHKEHETVEKLEKYTLEHAVDYLYFYDRWLPLDQMAEKLPVEADEARALVKKQSDIELQDTAFCHFLHVDTLLDVGAQMPVDYARAEIVEILMNIRQTEFMKRVRAGLYDEAMRADKVTRYY